ncbi:MAG: HU family DNA-binding protein [Tannerellaceae bacterium]|nr:HU family DNA-binding protein [Tannerellaceae bacterium]
MAAKYQLFPHTRSTLREGREKNLYPRIVRSRKVNLEEMSEHISASSTFTTSDVIGVWQALKREILEELQDGNRVELDGIGDFYVILKCRDITDPKEIRAESIRFSKVAFSPSKEIHRQLRTMRLERDEPPLLK